MLGHGNDGIVNGDDEDVNDCNVIEMLVMI